MLMAEQRNVAVAEDIQIRWNSGTGSGYRGATTGTVNSGTRPAVRRKNGSKTLLRIGLLLAVLAVANLMIQAMVIQRDYEARKLNDQIADMKRQMVQTRIEMASLESFDRIQALAESKLGMKVAGSSDYQCIAAAPEVKSEPLRAYAKGVDAATKDTIWNRVNSWIGNLGSAMAQNQ